MAAKEMNELETELRALDGYVSDTKFVAAFADEGVNKDMSNIVVVNGLPIAPEAKYQKLVEVLRTKLFLPAPLAMNITDEQIYMPLNEETKQTEGFAFVELKNKEDAEKVALLLDGAALDKNHTLRFVKYTDFQEFRKIGDQFVPPTTIDYKAKPDLYSWLMDEACRDQMVIRYSNTERQGLTSDMEKHETEILWAEARGPPAMEYSGEKEKSLGKYWTDSLVAWSPRGTFLTTLHSAGAKLWSGKGFREALKLPHKNVNEVLWSPDERFVCTWNGFPSNPHPDRAFIIWDAITGIEMKAFRQRRVQDEKPEFTWSADGKYIARINIDPTTATELVAVYQTPNFGIVGGASVKAAGARDLSWCPKKHNLVAYWTPEKDNIPTTVQVMRIPSKEYVRSLQLFSVESCAFFWHPQGDYLAVIAEKLTKGQAKKKAKTGGVVDRKQTAGFTIEIIRLSSKATVMGVEKLEVKDFVTSFAWEPLGSRFALISQGEHPQKSNVSFYNVEKDRGYTLLNTLEGRAVNQLHWSPRGEFILLAGLEGSLGGALEFYDVERKKTLAVTAHEMANTVDWDPSGRIVATYKTQPTTGATLTRMTVGNGYTLWSFQGGRLYATEKPKFFQLSWRPRPDSVLTEEEVKDVSRNLKKFISRYLQEDKERESRRGLLARLRKRKERDNFRAFLAERVHEWEENRELRIELGAEEPEEVAQVYEDVYEVFLGETVTVVE